MTHWVLTLRCENRPGIVAAVAACIATSGGNITEANQFDDPETGNFFMRVAFQSHTPEAAFRSAFAPIAASFGFDWTLRDTGIARRVLILCSRSDHCMADLLYRMRIGELAMDCVGIVSNHPSAALNLALHEGLSFHHFPVTRATKPAQEAQVRQVITDSGAELVVLARYMQVLSDGLSRDLFGRCINIHHSFLPGFKGAKPYHQAHARGVKMIGATGHFVTPDLDEGPIISQDVEHVSHADTAEDLVRRGRDIERRVLARAVRLYLEDRVLINGTKTVVFDR